MADATPHPLAGLVVALVCAVYALWRQNSFATCAFVAAGFFFLHSVRQTDSPGVRLARELGANPQAITVRGVVVSEPKFGLQGTRLSVSVCSGSNATGANGSDGGDVARALARRCSLR